jgi:hypothetical protein
MYPPRRLAIALALGLLLPGSGCGEDPAKDLATVLISGQWVKDHGVPAQDGNPPLVDQHVYTFAKDGRYTYKWVTDHNTPTVTGRWELAAGQDGKVLLQLKEQQGQKDYYWLAQQCFVRYDAKQDVLLVSGERYDGEQPLRHVKDEKKAR